MPEDQSSKEELPLTKPLNVDFNITKLILPVFGIAILLGTVTGYILANKPGSLPSGNLVSLEQPKVAQQDARTFRDFSEGIIRPKPQTENSNGVYSEGTHFLERDSGTPVALTSSVVDLSQYEGKKVKVFGETQKALKAGWLMDVGRVEEVQ